MVQGIKSNSLVIKKDASYAMKNFTFCAEPDLVLEFYRFYPEIMSHLMMNLEESIENITTPNLSSLENLLYVFESFDQNSRSKDSLLEQAKEICRNCNLSTLYSMTSDTN